MNIYNRYKCTQQLKRAPLELPPLKTQTAPNFHHSKHKQHHHEADRSGISVTVLLEITSHHLPKKKKAKVQHTRNACRNSFMAVEVQGAMYNDLNCKQTSMCSRFVFLLITDSLIELMILFVPLLVEPLYVVLHNEEASCGTCCSVKHLIILMKVGPSS